MIETTNIIDISANIQQVKFAIRKRSELHTNAPLNW